MNKFANYTGASKLSLAGSKPGIMVRKLSLCTVQYTVQCAGLQIRIRVFWSDPVSNPVFEIRSDPEPVFKIWSDPEPVFKIWAEPDTV